MENNTQSHEDDFSFKKYPIDRSELGTRVKNLLTQGFKDTKYKQNIVIDANYGFGKTTFMKCLQDCLEKQETPKINTCLIDVWKYEYVDEPLFSLLFGLEDHCKKKACKALKGLDIDLDIGARISFFVTIDVRKSTEKIWGSLKNLHNQVKKILDTLSKGAPVVIFLDELDRVSPRYAVKTLERIKHFFDHPKITFVIAMNLKESISHINSYYGSNDGEQYIEKTLRAKNVKLPKINETRDVVKELIRFFMKDLSVDAQGLSYPFRSILVNFEGNLRNFESLKTELHLFKDRISESRDNSDLFFIGLYLLVVKNISGQFGDISKSIKEGKATPTDIKNSLVTHFDIKDPVPNPPPDTTEARIQAFCDMFAEDAKSCVNGETSYFKLFGDQYLSKPDLLREGIVRNI